ncbi:hypothetical protein IWQ62_001937 [Dispira parvispora]|uniref:Beta-catenin-like protein 1 N-terminal domain-containing protein n=1 Tax=Dispira parvispora TaxID=1520584 RepID=A0A9W8AWU2_9FUNG|nr:hypothetical protein IWQ62_001937 [Dispira parvispora]
MLPFLPPPKRKPSTIDPNEHLPRRLRTQSPPPPSSPSDVDDEGGRFFADGLSHEQREILTIVDELDTPEDPHAVGASNGAPLPLGSRLGQPPDLTTQGIRRLITQLEKAIHKNQELRVKHADVPARFMESEVELDQVLTRFLDLTQAPQRLPDLIQFQAIPLLVSLLTHENTDIAATVVRIFNEWTDEDTFTNFTMDSSETLPEIDGLTVEEAIVRERTAEQASQAVVRVMQEVAANQGLELLVQNLARLTEDTGDDAQTVFQTLGIIENLTNLDSNLVERLTATPEFYPWLIRILSKRPVTSNVQTASEILVILLQSSRVQQLRWGQHQGIDCLLRALAPYRKRDPASADEEEFMENLFDALCLSITEPELKYVFLKDEGLELMLFLLREQRLSRTRALKVLNYATSSDYRISQMLVARFLDRSGLVPLIKLLMQKGQKEYRKKYKQFSPADEEEHTICVLAALLKHTQPATLDRWRIIHKFMERGMERMDRLVELHWQYVHKLTPVDREIAQERQAWQADGEEIDEDMETEFYTRRLVEGGLFTLQHVDICLLYLCWEEPSIRKHVSMLFKRRGKSLNEFAVYVRDYLAHAAEDDLTEEDSSQTATGAENETGEDTLEKERHSVRRSYHRSLRHLLDNLSS